MNYYEELGVPEDAKIPEIRRAYKITARLLHPDGQPDEDVRRAAEREMARLNEVLATLTDPLRRAAYDDSLLARVAPEPPVPCFTGEEDAPSWRAAAWEFCSRRWFWILMGTVAAATLASVAMLQQGEDRPAAEVSRAVGEDTGREPSPEAGESGQQASPASTARAQRPFRSPEAEEVRAPEAAAPPPPAVGPPDIAGPVPAAIAAIRDAAPARLPQEEHAFAGTWLAPSAPRGEKEPGRYRATYVELKLTESESALSGAYRARYVIPDQAISPEVRFQLQGPRPDGKSAKLAWRSADDAQGEAELTLRSPGEMRIAWWTTQFGKEAALSSGSAVLMRQRIQ